MSVFEPMWPPVSETENEESVGTGQLTRTLVMRLPSVSSCDKNWICIWRLIFASPLKKNKKTILSTVLYFFFCFVFLFPPCKWGKKTHLDYTQEKMGIKKELKKRKSVQCWLQCYGGMGAKWIFKAFAFSACFQWPINSHFGWFWISFSELSSTTEEITFVDSVLTEHYTFKMFTLLTKLQQVTKFSLSVTGNTKKWSGQVWVHGLHP